MWRRRCLPDVALIRLALVPFSAAGAQDVRQVHAWFAQVLSSPRQCETSRNEQNGGPLPQRKSNFPDSHRTRSLVKSLLKRVSSSRARKSHIENPPGCSVSVLWNHKPNVTVASLWQLRTQPDCPKHRVNTRPWSVPQWPRWQPAAAPVGREHAGRRVVRGFLWIQAAAIFGTGYFGQGRFSISRKSELVSSSISAHGRQYPGG